MILTTVKITYNCCRVFGFFKLHIHTNRVITKRIIIFSCFLFLTFSSKRYTNIFSRRQYLEIKGKKIQIITTSKFFQIFINISIYLVWFIFSSAFWRHSSTWHKCLVWFNPPITTSSKVTTPGMLTNTTSIICWKIAWHNRSI